MATLQLAPQALRDLDRCADFLMEESESHVNEVIGIVLQGLEILRAHPLIGRPLADGLRVLVISRGRTGYVALYRYHPETDHAMVLAIRHQCEAGFDEEV